METYVNVKENWQIWKNEVDEVKERKDTDFQKVLGYFNEEQTYHWFCIFISMKHHFPFTSANQDGCIRTGHQFFIKTEWNRLKIYLNMKLLSEIDNTAVGVSSHEVFSYLLGTNHFQQNASYPPGPTRIIQIFQTKKRTIKTSVKSNALVGAADC